ncbi:MAG TPA: protein kinase [Thermoanaerobaculia bacterium]|nr:protein kinase [Thermoanaerobaculia bacterium]
MAITTGSRLGPYEIVSRIGAGGMGEVFRARDIRLDRSVAIKVLPTPFAHDAQLKLRFEREAKIISQLNHPHICTLFDIGQENGTEFLVMELLDGETLADRLARGPLPLEQFLLYAVQITQALDKAHRQGVVHRDLKPGNVMLTKSGAKLLDFGLAKSAIIVSTSSQSMLAAGATEHKPLTQEGTIVGTFQYMAPEQLEGIEADARTDIFSFGAVLYEMATGRRAFEGTTRTSLIAAIVSAQPVPISQLQPVTPPAIDHVVQRCLQKNPDERWQSAHDVAEELRWIQRAGSQAGVAAPVAARRKTRERFAWALHLLTAAAAVGITLGVSEMRREPPRVITSAILPPQRAQFTLVEGAPAISPDGTRIVFPARGEGAAASFLWVRPLSGSAAQPLAGTEDAGHPFWSPDSRYIGFFAGGKLKKIDANGGPPQALADAQVGRGGSWSVKDVIVFSPVLTGQMVAVPATGGVPKPVTELDYEAGVTTHRYPWFLPDGDHFLYLALGSGQIHLGSTKGDVSKTLATSSSQAIYANGHLLYVRDGSLVAQPFDTKTLTASQEITPLAEGINITERGEGSFSVSATGTMAYAAGEHGSKSRLTWLNRDGKLGETIGEPAFYETPAVSRDGRRIAVGMRDSNRNRDIWILDLARATSTRLTFDASDERAPIWSPNDDRVVYQSTSSSAGDIAMKRSSGTGAEEVIHANPEFTLATDWSRDGRFIAFQEVNAKEPTGWDIWLYSMADRKATLFLQTPFAELTPRFSPDGKWLSYTSDESGLLEIYVQAVSGGGGKWQVSNDGGRWATWSRDGKQLHYLSGSKLMVVDVGVAAAGEEFQAGVPRQLADLPRLKTTPGAQYSPAPDGRFVVNLLSEETRTEPVTLVQNWPMLLQKK